MSKMGLYMVFFELFVVGVGVFLFSLYVNHFVVHESVFCLR